MKRIIYILKASFKLKEFEEYEKYINENGYEISIVSEKDSFVPEYSDIVCTDSRSEYERLNNIGEEAVGILRRESDYSEFAGAKYVVLDLFDVDVDYYEKVWRRFRKLPWIISESERLILRETTLDDIDDLVDIYKDPEMTRYNEPLYQDIEQEKKYILEYIDKVYSVQGFGIWSLYSKEHKRVIGRAGLVYREGYDDVEIGFAVGKDYQNKGYATEGIKECLKIAGKLDFAAVNALVMHENINSISLLKKLGFIYVEERTENQIKYDLYRYKL